MLKQNFKIKSKCANQQPNIFKNANTSKFMTIVIWYGAQIVHTLITKHSNSARLSQNAAIIT